MTGPSSTPRPEHSPRPGVTWESWAQWLGERYVPDQDTSTPTEPTTDTTTPGANDPQPPAPPNRATRRAIARAARRKK